MIDAPLPADAKIALLSPCGWGNLGDAAILEATIQGIRRRLPSARIVAFTLNPADTRQRHGIEAYTLLGFSAPDFLIREPGPASAPGDLDPASPPAVDSSSAPGGLRALPGHLRRSALGRKLAGPAHLARDVPHLARSARLLRGCSLIVVAGGGQLDDFYGGAWGQPWALFRWGLLARALGAGYAFLSVGTGRLSNPGSRILVRKALGLARYRSFRDEESRRLAGAPELTR